MAGREIQCLDCQTITANRGRGLCRYCYHRRRYTGTLIDRERTYMAASELLEEWALFPKTHGTHGANVRAFAERLGRNFAAVERALLRAGIRANAA